MSKPLDKQLVLKPQDLVLAIKIAVNPERDYILIELASQLGMALSAVHGAIQRGEKARLVSRSGGSLRALRPALTEFVIHGAKYAYPGELGPLSRGVPTAIAGPTLREHFEAPDQLPPVWPDPEGIAFGPSLLPLCPSVPAACRLDARLLDALTLLDALRVGAARERELAHDALHEVLG